MNTQPQAPRQTAHDGARDSTQYQLRFQSLFDEGRGYAFPCDARGQVDMDSLGDRLRNSYLYARTLIGREFAMPAVLLSAAH